MLDVGMPPHDTEAEAACLSSILLSKDAFAKGYRNPPGGGFLY